MKGEGQRDRVVHGGGQWRDKIALNEGISEGQDSPLRRVGEMRGQSLGRAVKL